MSETRESKLERNLEIAIAVLAGKTLVTVAKKHSISANRVRQITFAMCNKAMPNKYKKEEWYWQGFGTVPFGFSTKQARNDTRLKNKLEMMYIDVTFGFNN